MIGYIVGEVIFSDGNELILLTGSGIGHQIYFNKILIEGSNVNLFISHIIRETSEELYGFLNLRTKKIFEMLITVKGVGPKSAYGIVGKLKVEQITDAIVFQNKDILTQVSGVGPKAASQIMLDLQKKIQKVGMFSDKEENKVGTASFKEPEEVQENNKDNGVDPTNIESDLIDKSSLLNETLLACKELGFKEDRIISLAQKIVKDNLITRSEQLVHLVLKEI